MNSLLPVEEAQKRLFSLHDPLESENIAFSESLGRYLSQNVVALRDQPAAPLSAMDGYAIRFADLPGPWTIVGAVSAGAVPAQPLGAGETMRIFTGAMLPAGADTVVMQEDTDVSSAQMSLASKDRIANAQHVRARASDFAAGTTLLAAGTRLTAGAIAAAIMGGASQLNVGKRPRVAVLTTGDELVQPGREPAAGQIPDSNGTMLAAMLADEPAETGLPLHLGDDRAKISSVLKDLARRHDVIVTVGGASVGDHDHVRGALEDAGGRLDFWRIAMKPGKPLIAGTIGDALLLGLPGNPASAFVTAMLFLLPLVRHLAGAGDPLPPIQRAPLAAALDAGNGGRRDYMRARLDNGALTVFERQDSGRTFPLGGANALVICDIGAAARAAGDLADYIVIA